MWETATAARTEFAYLLQWPDEATMTSRRAANAESTRIKRVTGAAADGPLVGAIEDRVLCDWSTIRRGYRRPKPAS